MSHAQDGIQVYGESAMYGQGKLPFSPAIRVPAGYDLIFVAGCLGPTTPDDADPAIEREVSRAFSFLEKSLADAGASFSDVVHLTKYVTDMDAVNPFLAQAIYDNFPTLPASATVEVSRLVPKGLHVEISAIAALPPR